ncbi:MAG: hypothetical protein ACREN2_05635 [Candidatus Dormibacteria bacterium]
MTQDPPQSPWPDGPPAPPAAPPDGPPLPAEPPALSAPIADEATDEPEPPSLDEATAEPEPEPEPEPPSVDEPTAEREPEPEPPRWEPILEPPVVEAPPVALEPPTVGAPPGGFHPLGGTGPPVELAPEQAPAATGIPALGKAPPARRRKRRWLIVLAVVVVVVLLGGGGTAAFLLTRPSVATVGPQTSPRPSGSGTTAAYTDPNHYYTAQFDGAPVYHSTQQSTSAVGNVPYLYAEYIGPDVDQLVGVLVFDPGTTFDAQKGLQGIATQAHGSVVSSTPSTFQTFPSLEGVITLSGEYLKVQLVHTGNLAYVIGTAGPVNPPTDYQRFIASVHVTPH